jgi:hypothetical protein
VEYTSISAQVTQELIQSGPQKTRLSDYVTKMIQRPIAAGAFPG